MTWSLLKFGKHKGKTLPRVVLSDPDWFFWAINRNGFRNRGEIEDEAVHRESQSEDKSDAKAAE